MAQVMGLDPAMGKTGVCLPSGATYTITPRSSGDDRLTEVRDHILAAVAAENVTHVVSEDVPSNMKGAAGKVIPMLHGAIRAGLKDARIPYVVLSPSTLKKYATGNGSCDKIAMAVAAFKRAQREFKDDNQCDAWWLWIAGQDRFGAAPFTLPALQRKALEVVEWWPEPGATVVL
jgi:Holliday junction resolvasome RuvABC endonuclease subunit